MKNKISILAERSFTLLIFAALFLAPPAAFAGLTELFSATGKLFLSVDGAGSNSASHTAQVEKPNASATVRQAFVLAASVPSCTINNGNVSINGNPISWDDSFVNAGPRFTFFNVRADVTSIVKPGIDAASPGRINFTFAESNTSCVDGEALVVVFDDPAQTSDTTLILLFGGQAVNGDTFAITLGEPIDPVSPSALADMGLGISFGFQGGSGHVCGTSSGQFSIVNVNGQRLTSCAGNFDDGQAADGALITVGGLDDSNDNPADPFQQAADGKTPRVNDDELYSLLPFITANDTSISVFSQNPSNDDNIFFAYFHLSGAAIVGEGIVLSPTGVSNPVGTQHTVTAKVSNDNGVPVQGALVTFNVISGPNAGDNGTDTTNVNGEATFTYTGDGGAGTDQIQASFVDSQEKTKTSNTVTKEWTPTEANTPPVADPESVTTVEDTPKTITLTGSDADNDPLTCDIVTPPEHGTVSECTAATSAQLSRARRRARLRLQKERRIPGTMASTLSPSARSAVAASTLAFTVTYTPEPNYFGADSFTFKVNDGKVDSAPATVNITVTPEPDPPEIQNLSFARRTSSTPGYSTPGVAALLKLLNVDGNDSVSMTIPSIKAMNLPKGCGPGVLPSDEVKIAPPAIVETIPIADDPDSDDPAGSQGEIKVLEIGPAGIGVAVANGCQVTLKLTGFTIRATANPSPIFVLSEPLCIDSDGGAVYSCASSVPETFAGQSRTRMAGTKIAPPAVR